MIIVDTTVIIDIWRGNEKVKKILKKFRNEDLHISMITIAELYDGLGYTKKVKNISFYEKIKNQIDVILSEFYILPITETIIREAGLLRGELRANGLVIDIIDCIIGASAKILNAKGIITRNSRHFSNFKISIYTY
ncbi:MAG: type II toxin-antitoxin system VapC family toxin [Promethearchaeota archaeon]